MATAVTTDEAALLAAIRLHPAEDTPRLMYADWLDENAAQVPCPKCAGRGDDDGRNDAYGMVGECVGCRGAGRVPDGRRERAEFIRVQCEIARIVAAGTADPKRYVGGAFGRGVTPPDFERWKALDRRGAELHAAHRDDWWPADGLSLDWQRGFVDAVECPAAKWLERADTILAAHPVTRVRLTTLPEFRRPENALRDVYQLAGRRTACIVPPGEYIQSHLLRKEWPGIEFELPRDSYWPHQSPADYG